MSRIRLFGFLVVTICGLAVSCHKSKPAAAPKAAAPAPAPATKLAGTEWSLENLAGKAVLPNVKSTLAFPEAGRAAGNAGCNRFNGSVAIEGSSIKFGALATTRMACAPAANEQENGYMKALSSAERFTIDDRILLIFCRGLDKPLRFKKN